MALSVKLQTKQTQGLTMTPQLAQSIKLLQMNTVELQEYVEQELEKNPLLELSEDGNRRIRGEETSQVESPTSPDEIISDQLDVSSSKLEENLGTSLENEFDTDRSGGEVKSVSPIDTYQGGGSVFNNASGLEDHNLESFVAGAKTLRDHLGEQLSLMRLEPKDRLLCSEIIDNLDEDGYFRKEVRQLAEQFKTDIEAVETALKIVQTLEPTGVGARDLSECLKLQLKEQNRLDPAAETFLDNLDLLAQREFEKLQKICKLGQNDILDLVEEVRSLDPRPAKQFDTSPIQQIIPDAHVNEQADGSFAVELNSSALPKVLVNETYKAIVETNKTSSKKDKEFVSECHQNANWLVKSLEQRAQTILKVTKEIVKQQDAFFAYGLEHLKPMSLSQIADKIKMHESTVSRVTSNKYILCDRGMFEMKFFFTAAIQSVDGGEDISAEVVRQEIKHLIEGENIENILSDDAIAELLQDKGIDIARRTVAKYREAMLIPSSVQRRREKKAMVSRKKK